MLWPFAVSRTAYMRASRLVRFLCSRPFFTSRRTTSASVERSTPVCSTRPGLADVRILADADEDGVLARRQIRSCRLVREQHLGALAGPVQQMQGRDVEGA